MREITLGNKVKDNVSFFTGIATARHTYLNGCVQLTISGIANKDGESRAMDVDEEQVTRIGLGLVKGKKKPAGGPSRRRVTSRLV